MAYAVADRKIVPSGEIDCCGEHALGDVHPAGRAEAYPDNGGRFQSGFSDGAMHGFAHTARGIFGSCFNFRGDTEPGEGLPSIIHDTDFDIGAA